MKPQSEETQGASLCNFCGRQVYNRCIHQSQVKWCNQKRILEASEVYGRYETQTNGKLVERGIGPIAVTEPMQIHQDSISFTQGPTTTTVWFGGLSF